MSDRDTDIHGRGGWFADGEVVGHGNPERRIRERDGFFGPGREMGSVDSLHQVRARDGWLLQGEVVGQIRGQAVHAPDGWFLPGEQWGYFDSEGNVRQKDGVFFAGRVIGKVKGRDPGAALAFFVLRFQRLVELVDQLERECRGAERKAPYLGRIHKMLETVPQARALGDFDRLVGRLQSLESHVNEALNENLRRKEALCAEAESLSQSSEWKVAGQRLNALMDRWKAIDEVPRDRAEALWTRFRAAREHFHQRRTEHFARQDRERQENLRRKEALCSEAESLSASSDWKVAGARIKALMAEWKAVGPVPREKADALWDRFKRARGLFYERCNAWFDQKAREREQRQREWQQRMTEVLERKRDQVRRIDQSMDRDRSNVQMFQQRLWEVRPGRRADEIRSSLHSKVYDIEGRLRDKEAKVRDLEAQIREIEARLR